MVEKEFLRLTIKRIADFAGLTPDNFKASFNNLKIRTCLPFPFVHFHGYI
jgi:hypothetical protein